jgi:SpoVK/Ycf46/Vps4 family AAA+-type ATPase
MRFVSRPEPPSPPSRLGWHPPPFFLDGLPPLSAEATALFRVRLFDLMAGLVREHEVGPFQIVAGYPPSSLAPPVGATSGGESTRAASTGELGRHRSPAFTAVEPIYRFDQLVLPPSTEEQLLDCVAMLEVAPIVFGTWNLGTIEPHPSTSLNFRGPPGTGKSMAAHAVADRLGKKILLSRLSELESKFHGDGPKNLVELFASASAQDAVLFVDEAESLLSKRFAQPDQASESAINSMRTELFMALDSFDGLAIFASNLPGSYDQAIDSRLLHVDFSLPDLDARIQIWRKHLPPELPLSQDVSLEDLAAVEGVSGRDIKIAIIAAATAAARRGRPEVGSELLVGALERQIADRRNLPGPTIAGHGDEPVLSEDGRRAVADAIHKRLARSSIEEATSAGVATPAGS